MDQNTALQAKNKRMLVMVVLVVVTMIGASFAAVPLYRVFCQITGFGGTPQLADAAPNEDEILDRKITVKFNTDTARNIPWSFSADKREIELKLGQQGLISFSARNNGPHPVTGVAVYNVTPPKVGKYFHKIACFCFGEQTLNPGETASYPVVFFIDPRLDQDPNMQDLTNITLSYTYFQTDSEELDQAIEAFDVEIPDPIFSGTVALEPEKQ